MRLNRFFLTLLAGMACTSSLFAEQGIENVIGDIIAARNTLETTEAIAQYNTFEVTGDMVKQTKVIYRGTECEITRGLILLKLAPIGDPKLVGLAARQDKYLYAALLKSRGINPVYAVVEGGALDLVIPPDQMRQLLINSAILADDSSREDNAGAPDDSEP